MLSTKREFQLQHPSETDLLAARSLLQLIRSHSNKTMIAFVMPPPPTAARYC